MIEFDLNLLLWSFDMLLFFKIFNTVRLIFKSDRFKSICFDGAYEG